MTLKDISDWHHLWYILVIIVYIKNVCRGTPPVHTLPANDRTDKHTARQDCTTNHLDDLFFLKVFVETSHFYSLSLLSFHSIFFLLAQNWFLMQILTTRGTTRLTSTYSSLIIWLTIWYFILFYLFTHIITLSLWHISCN